MKKALNLVGFAALALLTSCAGSSNSNVMDSGMGYTISVRDFAFYVKNDGGRIIQFLRGSGGRNIIAGSDVNKKYYGSTLWLSPQKVYWPPYENLDLLPYKGVIKGDTLIMTSPVTKESDFQVKKKFYAADGALNIVYTIKNVSKEPKSFSPWDVTRVHQGLCFFPLDADHQLDNSNVTGAQVEGDLLVYPCTSCTNDDGQKLAARASGGWMAHVEQGLLFVKCFPDIAADQRAPGQGEAEIYVAPQGSYLELENHGAYTTLQPGEELEYPQKWWLVDAVSDDLNELRQQVEALDKTLPAVSR